MVLSIVVVIGAGLLLYFVLGRIVDSVIFRLAVGAGDPFEKVLTTGPDPRRAFVLNLIRPVILTVIIFGGGMVTVGLLALPTLGAVLAGAWYFFLTQYACLAGRGTSLNQAGWAMVVTIGIIIAAYMAVF